MKKTTTWRIVKSAALALMLAGSTTSLGTIIIENSDQFYESDTGATGNTISNFTVTEGDKLVVVGGWESAASTTISGITYGGQSLTEVVASPGFRHSVIWYLDNPAATTADVVVSFNEATGSRFGVMSLTGTLPGGPIAVNSNSGSLSIDLTTPIDNAFVVGVFTKNNHTVAATGPFADILYDGTSGSSWSIAGTETVATAGLNTYTWVGAGGGEGIAVAAFAAIPEPATLGLLAVGTLGLCLARRRRIR